MKKLLVILLLFFPVHGAWAKTLILECTLKGSSVIYYLDFSQGYVKNAKNLIVGEDLQETDNAYRWNDSWTIIDKIQERYPNYRGAENIVDRRTRNLNIYEKYKHRNSYKVSVWKCKKHSDKKKF